MTQYYGGKKKLGKKIADILLAHDTIPGRPYLEPFVGMGSIMQYIPSHHTVINYTTGQEEIVHRPRYGNDSHSDLIAMWIALQNGWVPPKEVTSEEHDMLRKEYRGLRMDDGLIDLSTSTLERAALRGFVGFGFSWSGCYFKKYTASGNHRAFRALAKTYNKLSDVTFINKSYDELDPHGMLIYCDPPYQIRTSTFSQYPGTSRFYESSFWDIMRKWSDDNMVFISERQAPSDFVSIWECPYVRTFKRYVEQNNVNFKPEYLEHLFVHHTLL